MQFKVGDLVEINCSKKEFCLHVGLGKTIYNGCFRDGIAEIDSLSTSGGFHLKPLVTGALHATGITSAEFKYLKLKEKPVQYKVGDLIELNCTKIEFCDHVTFGNEIHSEYFKDGVATINEIGKHGELHVGIWRADHISKAEYSYIKLKEVKMNTAQQIQAATNDIKSAQDKLKALQKQLKKEQEPKRVFGFLPKAGSGEEYYYIGNNLTTLGLMQSNINHAHSSRKEIYKGLFWKTEKEAEAFTQAMNTFLGLRAQPEVVQAENNLSQWYIEFDCDKREENHLTTESTSYYKDKQSPYFATEKDAQTVLARFGSERLEQMFRVLGGFKD